MFYFFLLFLSGNSYSLDANRDLRKFMISRLHLVKQSHISFVPRERSIITWGLNSKIFFFHIYIIESKGRDN